MKSELAVLQDQKAAIDPQVSYHHDLEKESQLFDAREDMLKKITANRISWTRKLDELIDVINVGGDGEKYLVWLDDLTVDQKESSRAKTYGSLKASGHSGSTSFAHIANFLDDLERSPFCEDFNRPAPPEGSQSSKDEGLMPAEIFNFPLEATSRRGRRRGPTASSCRSTRRSSKAKESPGRKTGGKKKEEERWVSSAGTWPSPSASARCSTSGQGIQQRRAEVATLQNIGRQSSSCRRRPRQECDHPARTTRW